MIKRIIASVFAAILSISLFAMPVYASWEEAGQLIDGTTKEMLMLLDDEQLLMDENEDVLIAEIEKVLNPVVDFGYISKRVMGKYYRRASQDQRTRFIDVFKTTLVKTYAKALVGFKIEKYALVPPRKESPDAKKQIVSVDVFAADGTKYTLVYYMLNQKGEWRLVNALLDGINLRLTFKNQFADMVQKNKGSVAEVISSWQEKVDPGKKEA